MPEPEKQEPPKEPEQKSESEEDVTDRISTLETKVDGINATLKSIEASLATTPKKENETDVSEHKEQEPESPDVDVKAPTEFRYVRKGRRIVKREVPVQPKKAG